MGFYHRRILPWLLDRAMRRKALGPQREQLLSEVAGEVLEIGFGTGMNLRFYPPGVTRVTAVEPHAGMSRRGREAVAASGVEVRTIEARADQRLPVPDGSFDSVVSTWTLCSIPDVDAALREVWRVLKPGGRFFFLEHGLAPDEKVARWQRRLTPLMKRIGGGCHLDRGIEQMVRASPLRVDRCETFYLPGEPRIGGFMYRGVASRE